ncbi:hypothetical protein CNMCM5793_007395 [Aspergillus hiratsukae]|uniref:Ankyrin n=1 Tax=Aspergillus hiratsukae TaxID=1194566 RepID=A0A8H6PIJ3_9EURO|nr:hypothetical protein CNMCM5793_007395 [Aspergillus hiratsukae]
MAELVLAIVGGIDVLARTSFAVARLVNEWKNAPTQITALSEEIHHFHAVTLRLKEFALQLTTYPDDDLQVAVIKGLVSRAEPYLAQLQKVVQGSSQGVRIGSSITTYQHDQKIWFDSTTQSLSEIMAKLEDKTDQPPHYSPRAYRESSYSIDTRLSIGPQTISATVRQVDNSCSASCGCRCHVGKKCGQFRIAPFHSLFGSISIIFFGWRLMGPRCNIPSCHKMRMKLLEVTYSTPLKPLGISVVASARFYDGTPSIGISLGPTINVTNEQDYRSIFPCVRGRKLPELKQMLQGRPGAVVDVSHRQGFSSLHYAFELGSIEAIKVLLAAGSDPFHEDHWGMPAIFDAFVRMLAPAKSSGSIQAEDKVELEKTLPFPVFFDDYNFTHIHRVVVGARPVRLEAALSTSLHTADLNAQDDMGMTPLHWAALKDDVDAVSALLAAGADVTIRNKRGKTALWKACLSNAYACAAQLLAFGADINSSHFF